MYKWEHYFPYPEFRAGQDKIIDKIIEQFECGKKFVLAEMPTGAGKSAVGFTVGSYFEQYYYVTAQKILQSQLSADFGEDGKWSNDNSMVELKGRNAYPCNFYNRILCDPSEQKPYNKKVLNRFEKLAEEGVDCACGECKRKGKGKFDYCMGHCPYWIQLHKAVASPATLMNFHSFLFQTEMVQNRWKPRRLLIIDECHGSESVLMDYISIKFNDIGYDFEIPELETAEGYLNFFESIDLVEIIKEKVAKAVEDNNSEDEDYWKRQILKFKKFKQSVSTSEWIPKWEKKHIIEGDVKSPTFRSIELKPLYVRDFAHELLFDKADHVLMMSATILSVGIVCDALGIDRNELWATRAKSRFPVKNRPIIVCPSGSMSYANRDVTLPKMHKDIEKICSNHEDYRGIIHTHNFMIAEHIIENSSKELKDRLFFQKNFDSDKDVMLREHAKSKNGIIIAPAMHEGLDLKEELCYDAETEILTEFGWVQLPNLLEGVKVAAFNDKSKEINFEIPQEIIKTKSKSWVEFDTITNNLMVTSKHRMLWRNSQTGNYKETIASKAPDSKYWQFVCGGMFLSNGIDLSDDQIKLAVVCQVDKCWLTGNDTRVMFNLRQQIKINRLRSLLNKMGISYETLTTSIDDVMISISKIHLIPLQMLGGWPNNKLWKYENLLKLSLHQRKIFLSELSYWDDTDKSLGNDSKVYTSSLIGNINTIQALATLTGYKTSYSGHKLTWENDPYSLFAKDNFVKKEYDVFLPCYCVTVSTGWIVVRRRGKVTISGNSRFQIICKVPYPPLKGDPQLERRIELSNDYYQFLAALKLCQSIGRSVRSETDWAKTFILDSGFTQFITQSPHLIPKWIKEAIEYQ